ncbi:unknown protein [Seminavis robusta]|uniref:Uncharacterized protein n=1 Tax=Seminavis robusta TaxID=568900 RepID=A0A9N8EWU2_9STRA|nr:unknown protein [Seminavis robusta]|eukprot:Sro2564_g331400.1 n/a (289) ;mRNA; f:3777-4643
MPPSRIALGASAAVTTTTRLAASPLVPYCSIKGRKDLEEEDENEVLDAFKEYVEKALAQPFCYDVTTNPGRKSKCSCLNELRPELDSDDLDECVKGMLLFCKYGFAERNRILKEWIRSAMGAAYILLGHRRKDQHRVHLPPGSTNRFICKNALAQILGIGRSQWSADVKFAKDNKDPVHGLKGKPSNRMCQETQDVLHEFFNTMKELAMPRATKVVRQQICEGITTTIELVNDDLEMVELPSCMTKRGLYNRFVGELGWTIKWDTKARILKKTEKATEQKVTADKIPT